jgi:aspartokinase
MSQVALVSLEPASPELNGVQVMARALDAVARANVEVLLLSSSSYRQNFCFLVREEELEARWRRWNRRWRWNWRTTTCSPSTWTGTWGCWRR